MAKQKKRAGKILKKSERKGNLSNKRKIILILSNLIIFGILTLVFYILYAVLSPGIFQNLFGILSIIGGFISIAFLMVLLIFLFLRLFKKK